MNIPFPFWIREASFFQGCGEKSPFLPDNSHIHHLVLTFAKSHALSSIIISGSLALIIMLFSNMAFAIDPQITVYIYFGGLFFGYILLFLRAIS